MSDADIPWKLTRSDDPRFHDPRFQRQIVATYRPIAFVENMHDVKLDCGHAPLVFCAPDSRVGDMIFCPDCYDKTKGD